MRKLRRKAKIFVAVFLGAGFFLSLAWAQGTASLPAGVRTIIENNCLSTGCHVGKDPAMRLNLEPSALPAAIVGRESLARPDFKIIDPVNPAQSYLLMKLRGDAVIAGKRMPLGRDPLKQADLDIIAGWVAGLKGKSGMPAAAAPPDKPAFWGMTVVNLPTTQSIEKGKFLFCIAHRYEPSVKEGYAKFFGLDGPANVLDSIGVGLSDKLSLTLGRSRLDQEVVLSARYAVLAQSASVPFSLSVHAGTSLVTEKVEGRSFFDARNFKFHAAVSIARKISQRLSLLLVPAYASNVNHLEGDRKGVFSLGLAGRFMIFNDFSLIAEWIPVLAGFEAEANGWGFGMEAKIGGHVFQFFVLNSRGVTPAQFLSGGDLLIKNGDLRIGFNIYRAF